jgi:hypothetical protein
LRRFPGAAPLRQDLEALVAQHAGEARIQGLPGAAALLATPAAAQGGGGGAALGALQNWAPAPLLQVRFW